jgi:hypothetical protein
MCGIKLSAESGAVAFCSLLVFPNVVAIGFIWRMVYILHNDDSMDMFYKFSCSARNGLLAYILAIPFMFILTVFQEISSYIIFFLTWQMIVHPFSCVITIIFYSHQLNLYCTSFTRTVETASVATPAVGTPVVGTLGLPATLPATSTTARMRGVGGGLPTDLREWRPWFDALLSSIRVYEEDVAALQHFRNLLIERRQQRLDLQQRGPQREQQVVVERVNDIYTL